MARIAIVGWYGTETTGDRAILAGLLSLFGESFTDGFEVSLGSMYPFYTRRTQSEDLPFLRLCAGNPQLDVPIFDVQKPQELNAAIRRCDLLVMGGGPLMGMPSLFMVEYAFARARQLRRRTLVLGCGVGPMRRKIYERSLAAILRAADGCILRDRLSLDECTRIAGAAAAAATAAIDPAVFAAIRYAQASPAPEKDDAVVACLRSFPEEYSVGRHVSAQAVNCAVKDAVSRLCAGRKTLLLPMHCFGVGGDDRYFLNHLCRELQNPGVTVQNEPLTLCQTLERFRCADLCIGMRFHAVVLQTVLNGRNLILDYTDPAKGKIAGFIRQIGGEERYRSRYMALQESPAAPPRFDGEPFVLDAAVVTRYRETYLDALSVV
ncbi:MAG: polysaccharide pyruvyl transferase family protein [Prevotellaceae bacterium]|jgi:polysaccharide pyruvyl transferase WcaK-like protein|nr:polysaccharide pyruvyl transferase family protein [Prevotellaceae bacterium]